MDQKLLNLVKQVQSYKNPAWVQQAMQLALTPEVQDNLEIEATIKVSENPNLDANDALAISLMDWFKNDFFTWFRPPKDSTPLPMTINQINGNRIENYRLLSGATLQFERINNPVELLKKENRKGRSQGDGAFSEGEAYCAKTRNATKSERRRFPCTLGVSLPKIFRNNYL